MLIGIIVGITLLYITVVVAYVYLMSEMPDIPDWEEWTGNKTDRRQQDVS